MKNNGTVTRLSVRIHRGLFLSVSVEILVTIKNTKIFKIMQKQAKYYAIFSFSAILVDGIVTNVAKYDRIVTMMLQIPKSLDFRKKTLYNTYADIR